ncbi:MAG: response regulator [Candidatus Methylomirabilales bacterium]
MIGVLLVDDHQIVRAGLRLLVERLPDCRVLGEAADGESAVRAAQTLRPDVVLMDFDLPVMNGALATQRIRATCPASQVVMLSMYADTEHVLQALEAGARGYLLKDCETHELAAALRAARAGHRYLSQEIAAAVVDAHLRQRAHPAAPVDRLSLREREIVRMVADGKSTAQIAGVLLLSPKTVETYRRRAMQKLGLSDLPALVKFALQHGLARP